MSPANPDMKTYPPIEHHPSEPRHLQFAGTSQTVAMCMDEEIAAVIAAKWNADQAGWQPIETAPRNESVLIYLPDREHYGEPIYRAILVDMGSGERWTVTGLHIGRDLYKDDKPAAWMPLPQSPVLTGKEPSHE